jgi:hypothetical protein
VNGGARNNCSAEAALGSRIDLPRSRFSEVLRNNQVPSWDNSSST